MADAKVKKEAGAAKDEDQKKPFNFNKSKLATPTGKFEGKVEALKGYYYDCTDNKQSDMFVKTTKEIAGYVGGTFRNGGEAHSAIEAMEFPAFDIPEDLPNDASKAALRLWEKELTSSPNEKNF